MKFTTSICAAVALSLASSGLALAQNRNDNDRRGYDQRNNNRQDNHRNFRDYRRGERLAPEYHNRQSVVDDWRGHNLRQPPRGYHWVQNGSDYALVAIATGIIADLLQNHR